MRCVRACELVRARCVPSGPWSHVSCDFSHTIIVHPFFLRVFTLAGMAESMEQQASEEGQEFEVEKLMRLKKVAIPAKKVQGCTSEVMKQWIANLIKPKPYIWEEQVNGLINPKQLVSSLSCSQTSHLITEPYTILNHPSHLTHTLGNSVTQAVHA
jgi:hypothetical protein